eukprot:4331980-Pyramimonas_sp.AAC.1
MPSRRLATETQRNAACQRAALYCQGKAWGSKNPWRLQSERSAAECASGEQRGETEEEDAKWSADCA